MLVRFTSVEDGRLEHPAQRLDPLDDLDDSTEDEDYDYDIDHDYGDEDYD